MSDFIEDILGHIPKNAEFKVNLPSKGKLYQNFDHSKGVTVRPTNFNDELNVVNLVKNEKDFDVVAYFIENCTQGVKYDDLLLMDRFSILLKLREVSYGEDYKTIATCPGCKTENNLTFRLADLPIKYLPEDFKEPVEITLPVLKKKVKVRLIRTGDSAKIGDELGKNLWRFIVDFDGEEDLSVISNLILDPRFPLRDIKLLMETIAAKDYGVQTEAEYKCQNCGKRNPATFEVNPDFFSLS